MRDRGKGRGAGREGKEKGKRKQIRRYHRRRSASSHGEWLKQGVFISLVSVMKYSDKGNLREYSSSWWRKLMDRQEPEAGRSHCIPTQEAERMINPALFLCVCNLGYPAEERCHLSYSGAHLPGDDAKCCQAVDK